MNYLELAKQAGVAAPPLREPGRSDDLSPLVALAQEYAAVVCLTIAETEDVAGDIAFLRLVRAVIEEFQPGTNEVRVRLPTLDGRRPVVRWRALASRELRMTLARLLARRASWP